MTLRQLTDLEQRSDEWYAARRGMITASAVGQLISVAAPDPLTVNCPTCAADVGSPCLSQTRKTPTAIKTIHDTRSAAVSDVPPRLQVAEGDTARGLITTLAAERITGWTEETAITPDMWRGIEHETFARDVYAEHHAPVVEVGFMIRDESDWRLGYSPDGLVGDDGLIEIKCPRAKAHVSTILGDGVPNQYMAQLQAGLLVSGRAWIDYVSFVGGMPLYVQRVEPDPAWQDAITAACISFEANVAQIIADYELRTATMPRTVRPDFEIKVA